MESTQPAGRREWLGLAVLLLPTLLVALDMTALFLALPRLSADLGASRIQQLWISDSYGFLVAGFVITMGTLGDRIGRRRLLLIGAAAFVRGHSVVAAYADQPGDADRGAGAAGHRRRDADALDPRADQQHVPGRHGSAAGRSRSGRPASSPGGALGPVVGGRVAAALLVGLGVPDAVPMLGCC